MFKTISRKLSSSFCFADALTIPGILFKKMAVLLALVAGVLLPCEQESFAIETKEWREVTDSGFMERKGVDQNVGRINVLVVAQSFQSLGEIRAESDGGGREIIPVTHIQSAKYSEQSGDNGKRPRWNAGEYIHAFIIGLMLALIPFVGLLRPNDNANRRAGMNR